MQKFEIRKWLKQARISHSFTQDELAHAISASTSAVQLWESGAVVPRFKHQRALKETLGIDAPALFLAEQSGILGEAVA
jgi:DNA-binding XRE family transcriptional regulator